MDFDPTSRRDLKYRLRHLTTSLARDPNNPDLIEEIGSILLKLERNGEALPYLWSAAQRYFDMGDYHTAGHLASKVLNLDPQDSTALRIQAHIRGIANIPNKGAGLDDFLDNRDMEVSAVEVSEADVLEEQLVADMESDHVGQMDRFNQQDLFADPQDPHQRSQSSTVEMNLPISKDGDMGSFFDSIEIDLSEEERREPSVLELREEHRHVKDPGRIATMFEEQESLNPKVQSLPLPEEFIATGRPLSYSAGQIIVREHEHSNALYLVKQGQVALYKEIKRFASGLPDNSKRLVTLAEGSCFGELAMLGDSIRHVTAKALQPCELLLFTKKQVRAMMRTSPQVKRAVRTLYRDRIQEVIIKTSPLFEDLPQELAEAFLKCGKPRPVQPDTVVLKQDELARGFYLVLLGTLEISKAVDPDTMVLLQRMSDGDFFGGISLLMDEPFPATIKSRSFVQLLHIPAQEFFRFGSEYPDLLMTVDTETKQRHQRYESILAGKAQYEVGTTVFLLEPKKK